MSEEFEKSLSLLGENIKNEAALAEILDDINNLGNFEKMFDGISDEQLKMTIQTIMQIEDNLISIS